MWCPKYRKRIFAQEGVKGRAEQLIREVSEEYGFEIIELEVAQEHVNILVSFSPKCSIGEVCQRARKSSPKMGM